MSYMRLQFVSNKTLKTHEIVLFYFAMSLIYHSALFTFTAIITDDVMLIYSSDGLKQIITKCKWWFLSCLWLLPFIAGIFVIIETKSRCVYRLLSVMKLRPVSGETTAWDQVFSTTGMKWMTVTLLDGTSYGTYYDESVIVASSDTNKDIYIDQLYVYNSMAAEWEYRPEKSILIMPDQISKIEFRSNEVITPPISL